MNPEPRCILLNHYFESYRMRNLIFKLLSSISLFGSLSLLGEESQTRPMNIYFEIQIRKAASIEPDDLLDRLDRFLGECGKSFAVDVVNGSWIIFVKGDKSLKKRLADYKRESPAEWNFRFIQTGTSADFEVLLDKNASGDLDDLCDHLDEFLGECGNSYAAHGNKSEWVINVMSTEYEPLIKRLADFKAESPAEWKVRFNQINVIKKGVEQPRQTISKE